MSFVSERGVPVPNSSYGLCGCKRAQELRQSVKDELQSLIVPTVSVDVRELRSCVSERRAPVPVIVPLVSVNVIELRSFRE